MKRPRLSTARDASRGFFIAAAIALATSAHRDAQAGDIDATAPLPIAIATGQRTSPWPLERGDVSRTGASAVTLPGPTMAEASRRSIGSLVTPPIAAGDGGLFAALASPELMRLDAKGAEVFRTRIGPAPAARAPILLPNGSVAILTNTPSLVFVSAKGSVTSTVALPRLDFALQASAMIGMPDGFGSVAPTEDGAVVVAANRSLLVVEPSGTVRTKAELPDAIASDLFVSKGRYLFVGAAGGVYEVAPPNAPRRLASFAAPPNTQSALTSPRTLVAQIGASRLVALDLSNRESVVRVSDKSFAPFDAPFVASHDGSFTVSTSEGFLVRYDSAGGETFRVAIDRATTAIVGRPGGLQPGSARGMVVPDPSGAVAFIRPNGRLGLRNAEGRVSITSERACGSPLALVPVANESLVLACREGTLVFYGPPR